MTRAAEGGGRLRRNFAATFVGNALFAASQWAVLSLIAKLGNAEMLGQYALAVAVAMPIALFSHLNLRAVLATDMEQRHPFGDYLSVRLWTSALAFAVTAAVAVAPGYGWPVMPAIVFAGAVLGFDNLSDIYYGALQRRERMDQVAISTTARGLLSAGALGGVLWFTQSLPLAMAAQAGARLAVLIAYDRPKASAGESLATSGRNSQMQILSTALPLGLVLMLGSLVSNLPRYSLERELGFRELGIFAAVASFLTVGATVVNALGQAATPRLARHFSDGERRAFGELAWRLTGLAVVLGFAGVGVALAIGPWVLRVLYRPAYAAYAGLLVWVMAAAVLNYVASMLGYVITSTRAFKVQAPLFGAMAIVCGGMSVLLVPRLGLGGAVAALAGAWTVQLAGEVLILARVRRSRGQAG